MFLWLISCVAVFADDCRFTPALLLAQLRVPTLSTLLGERTEAWLHLQSAT